MSDEQEIEELLAEFEGPEAERVRRAVALLAKGSLPAAAHYLAIARIDYRDVLYWAEYPDEVETARRSLRPDL